MTRSQALFIKYLTTRFDYNYFVGGSEPKNVFGEVIRPMPGTSFRDTAMYFYSRYADEYIDPEFDKGYIRNKKWWEQGFTTSQIDGCILIDKAVYVLNDFGNKYPNSNYGINKRTWQLDRSFYKYLPDEVKKTTKKLKKPMNIRLSEFIDRFKRRKPIKWKIYGQ